MSQNDKTQATTQRWLPTPLVELLLFLLPALAIALGGSGGGLDIPVSTVANGGGSHSTVLENGTMAGSTLEVDFTVGLSQLGLGQGADGLSLAGGFQVQREAIEQVATTPLGPTFRRGDINSDSLFNIADAVAMLNFLFLGGGLSCADAGDSNDDGSLDISDSIFLLSALFGDGGLPPAPGVVDCGSAPTDDALSCEVYSGC